MAMFAEELMANLEHNEEEMNEGDSDEGSCPVLSPMRDGSSSTPPPSLVAVLGSFVPIPSINEDSTKESPVWMEGDQKAIPSIEKQEKINDGYQWEDEESGSSSSNAPILCTAMITTGTPLNEFDEHNEGDDADPIPVLEMQASSAEKLLKPQRVTLASILGITQMSGRTRSNNQNVELAKKLELCLQEDEISEDLVSLRGFVSEISLGTVLGLLVKVGHARSALETLKIWSGVDYILDRRAVSKMNFWKSRCELKIVEDPDYLNKRVNIFSFFPSGAVPRFKKKAKVSAGLVVEPKKMKLVPANLQKWEQMEPTSGSSPQDREELNLEPGTSEGIRGDEKINLGPLANQGIHEDRNSEASSSQGSPDDQISGPRGTQEDLSSGPEVDWTAWMEKAGDSMEDNEDEDVTELDLKELKRRPLKDENSALKHAFIKALKKLEAKERAVKKLRASNLKMSQRNSTLQKRLQSTKEKLDAETLKISLMEDLICSRHLANSKEFAVKDGSRFVEPVVKCIYQLQAAKIPDTKIGYVMSCVAEMFTMTIKGDTPSEAACRYLRGKSKALDATLENSEITKFLKEEDT